MPDFEASKTLKDPEKIKVDLDNKRRDWLNDSALHANRGRILILGMLLHDGKQLIMQDAEEKDILIKFWKHYNEETSNIYIGHYIKGFDIPFICRRSWLNGLSIPHNVMNGRYLSNRFIDTMEAWSCGNNKDTISLDNLAKAFGLEGKNGDGAEFGKLWNSGDEGRKKALDYHLNDLKLTKMVAERMGLI